MNKRFNNKKLTPESKEYLEFLKDKNVQTSSKTYTVTSLSNAWTDGIITVNHEYQRPGDQWSTDLEKGLLLTWLEGYPTPPIILARTTDENGNVCFEVVDGQQRMGVAKKWMTNNLRLPDHLPKEIAGGRNRRAVHPNISSKIDEANIPAVILDSCDEEQIKEIYGRLQRGVRLNLGQELRWQYGDIKTVLQKLSKHELIQYMAKFGEDYILSIAAYILAGVIGKQEKKVPRYKKKEVLQMVQKYRNHKELWNIYKECALRANFLKDVFEQAETTNVKVIDMASLNEVISESENWQTDKRKKHQWTKVWATYTSKLQEAHDMKKANIDLAMDAEEWGKRGLLRYYDIVDQTTISQHANVDMRRVVLQKEFEEV